MAITVHVDIVSAREAVFSGPAEMVIASVVLGEIGILPRHTPLLTQLRPGEVRVKLAEGQEESFYVSGGILEVQPHVVTVLADTAMRARDLDEAKALAAKGRAEQMLRDKISALEYAQAVAELAEAVAQLQTINKLRQKSGVR
ncbi:MAG: F0F1 ATP synthase subunit epsilon [Gammaproteobacteria bacterium]|nr:F0F1 ATP synthase subunit epsilon [Gammaproteobacteria bacterium]